MANPTTGLGRASSTLAAALVALASACVVTTHEGPGDPPQVPTRPTTATSQAPTEPVDADANPEPASPQTIAASHLLVMHTGSMRAPANITRSKDEARTRAEEALARAKAGEDFAQLVAEYSDEPGASLRQGRLGRFTRDAMIEQFADPAFKLKPGELSGVVETPYGFHVILRTE